MALVRILRGPGQNQEFTLEPGSNGSVCSLVIGRDAQRCEIALSARTVSRLHASVSYEEGEFVLRDLESKAGTFLNGCRVQPNVAYPLKHRDLINICDSILSFVELDQDTDSGSSTDEIVVVDDDDTGYFSALDSSAASLAERMAANAQGKLAALMRLTLDLRSTVDLDTLLAKVLDSLLAMFLPAARGVIMLQGREPDDRPRTLAKFRQPLDEGRVVLSRRILREVLTTRRAIVPEDGMMMVAPLLDREEQALGVIQLAADPRLGPFQSEDLDLLLTVALQVSFAVENALLYETALRERNLELELGIAHGIQVSLLPASPPEIEGYEFFDYYAPARHVGGDYYDYLELPDQRLAILLGDVSGKGVPAALLMAKASTEFSVYLSTGMNPVEVVSTVNRRFLTGSPKRSFMTLVLAVLDWSAHRVVLVNAGHIRPLVRRVDGEVVEIGEARFGLPLGILPEMEYQQTEFALDPGEAMLLVTDGITEARHNGEDKVYGLKRLRALFGKTAGTAAHIGQAILTDIDRFVGDHPQTDDTCLLCVRRSGSPAPIADGDPPSSHPTWEAPSSHPTWEPPSGHRAWG